MVNYIKNNKCLNSVKINKKPNTHKEVTPPTLGRTLRICTEKTNVSTVKKSYECVDQRDLETDYKNRLQCSSDSREYYRPTPFPLSVQDTLVDMSKNMATEIAPSSLEEKWMKMTENEKNQWIKTYLYRIKNEVVNVYKIISDFQKGDGLQEELCELTSILSMVDIIPHDRLKSTINIQVRENIMELNSRYKTEHDYLTVAIQLKELQERHKNAIFELERNKNTIETLKEKLNKEKYDKDTQTHGIKVEELENKVEELENKIKELENNLKNALREKLSLYSKLDQSNLTITKLKQDIDVKNENFKTISVQNVRLNTKINSLVKSVEDAEKINMAKCKRIENLCEEKNKFKQEYNDISRERDQVTEETFELKNQLTETKNELFKLKSRGDKQRISVIRHSMQFSEQTDEINDKTNQIKYLEEMISKNEERIKYIVRERENFEQTSTIVDLEDNIIELKSEIDSWETRAGCWINTHVRKEFESEINDHKKQIAQLKVENTQLSRMYNNSISDKSKKIADNERIIEKKETIIERQNSFIQLMRKVQNHQTIKNSDTTLKQLVDDLSYKFSNSQEVMEENIRLRRIVDDFK